MSIENLTGSAFDDTLTGDSGANVLKAGAGIDVLQGGGGNDTLEGGAGADALDGGDGNDTASYAGSAAGVTVNLLTNTLSGGDAAGDTLTSIENLTGSANADTLTGNTFANVLDGGAGTDTMIGGLGDDAFTVDNAGDVVIELSGEGTDEVRTALASYTLGANVENLTGLSAGGQALTGNGLANLLDGGAGADTMAGGLGNDVYVVGAGDVVTELAGEGTDEVRTGLASYALTANVENLTGTAAGGQTLVGNVLANTIQGSPATT